MSYSDELEALEYDRFDADCEQAALEMLGRESGRAHRNMMYWRAKGDLLKAANRCLHGAGYPLASLAAKNDGDPRAGQPYVRCTDCGSVIDDFPFGGHRVTVIHPCEIAPTV